MRLVIVSLSICFLIGADSTEGVKKEMALLEGDWTMVSGERDGQALPDDLLKGSKRVVKSGETTVTIGGQIFMKAKYTIDPEKKPKQIDYTLTEGPNKGKTQLGIYEFAGETARFCFTTPGMERPTDFSTKEGSGRTLSVWKREKK